MLFLLENVSFSSRVLSSIRVFVAQVLWLKFFSILIRLFCVRVCERVAAGRVFLFPA